jgi:hypothetical protein
MSRWMGLMAVVVALSVAGCDETGNNDNITGDDDVTDGDDDVTDGDDDATGDDDDDVADDDSSAGDDDDTSPPIARAYMAVHLDPGSPAVDLYTGEISHARAVEALPFLAMLIAEAEARDHRLTLMFTAQWASYVQHPDCVVPDDADGDGQYEYRGLEYADCLDLMRAYEVTGHEIAMHHHPITAPATWDGYTDLLSWEADRDHDGADELYFADGGGPNGPDPLHLGSIAEMMLLVDGVPASGQVSSATSEEYPPYVQVSAAGGPTEYVDMAEPGDLVSTPCAADFDGHGAWQVRMRSFTNNTHQDDVMIDELPRALVDVEAAPEPPYTLGFVTHAINVQETGVDQYQTLFTQLSAASLFLEPLVDVVGSYAVTSDDPGQAAPDDQCPPEAP